MLVEVHWNEDSQSYCDVSVNEHHNGTEFIVHKGYMSLFPFLHNLVPKDSNQLKAVLDMLSDPDQLWTEWGIRSLSAQDEFYGKGENYWRGPIWINVNFLILRALHKARLHRGANG
jgi:mannosyl-oligosaccharide glucosidase